MLYISADEMKPPGNGISLSGEYSRCASPAKYRGP